MSGSGQKSSVAQTCNLLSQYLKENGRFAEISSLGMTPKLEANKGVETSRMQPGTTMNLLPNLENSSENSRQNYNIVKVTDFFQDIPSVGSPSTVSEHENSQMTIFYAGKVLVFNDFPAEKAKEIMDVASKGSSKASNGEFLLPPPSAAEKAISSRAVTPDLNMPTTSENNSNNIVTSDGFHPRAQAVPIARKASLRRFFEKRKDRVTARAPYQVNNLYSSSSMAAAPQKPEPQSKFPWLKLEAQLSKQLDLTP